MSMYARCYMLSAGHFIDKPERPRRKAWFEVSFIELVRPNGYWPQPYSLEQAFETFRWMAGKGKGYSSAHRWGSVGVKELLSATSGCGLASIDPIKSIAALRERFHYAILGQAQSESQVRWRDDHGIGPCGKVRITAPVYKPFVGARHLGWDSERAIQDDFTRLTKGCGGQRMAVPLNYVHLDCRFLHGVSVRVSADAFRFVLTFGEDPTNNPHASCWDKYIAVTRPGESFLDTFARACDVFDVIVDGAVKPCDPADLLKSCEYGMRWHTDYVAAFAAGDRAERAFKALREAEYADNIAHSKAVAGKDLNGAITDTLEPHHGL